MVIFGSCQTPVPVFVTSTSAIAKTGRIHKIIDSNIMGIVLIYRFMRHSPNELYDQKRSYGMILSQKIPVYGISLL